MLGAVILCFLLIRFSALRDFCLFVYVCVCLLNVCFQHDVSAGALKAALDGVVQECVSFVGVDINICSEILMR